MNNINLSLIENAESFINESLSKTILAEKDPPQWKYAILNLVHAIELSLKEILRREHWVLIYQSVDKPNHTVSLEGALQRLTGIAKISFDKDDIAAVSTAISLRNQIIHFEFSFQETQAKVVFAKLLGFLQHCFSKHLGKGLHEVVREQLWQEAIFLFDFANELYRRAEERIRSEGVNEAFILTCERCDSDSFIAKTDLGICYVCGYTDHMVQCVTCGQLLYLDRASEVGNSDLFCCDRCMEIGVLVNSANEVSRLDAYEEVQDESGEIYLQRKSKRT
ncbi:MAG TPA: hypothetical protein VJR02_17985 [Pyrinomonadaceae bacterium]|nr:hypothetical protein [Pyrinomonadaceae bacterium]